MRNSSTETSRHGMSGVLPVCNPVSVVLCAMLTLFFFTPPLCLFSFTLISFTFPYGGMIFLFPVCVSSLTFFLRSAVTLASPPPLTSSLSHLSPLSLQCLILQNHLINPWETGMCRKWKICDPVSVCCVLLCVHVSLPLCDPPSLSSSHISLSLSLSFSLSLLIFLFLTQCYIISNNLINHWETGMFQV
jgi:hypothetical protein